MKRRINFINSHNRFYLTFWYMYLRRNRLYMHNKLLINSFKLCLSPLRILLFNYYKNLFFRNKSFVNFYKITNLKTRYDVLTKDFESSIEFNYRNISLGTVILYYIMFSFLYSVYNLLVVLFIYK